MRLESEASFDGLVEGSWRSIGGSYDCNWRKKICCRCDWLLLVKQLRQKVGLSNWKLAGETKCDCFGKGFSGGSKVVR